MLALLLLLGGVLGQDVIFADFEDAAWPRGWVVSDDFPHPGPITVEEHSKDFTPSGFGGKRFVTTYINDASRGTLISPPFQIEKNYIRVSVGGGNHADDTYVGLFIDGKRVLSETGSNNEKITVRVWNVTSYVGQTAEIRIVDQSSATWGMIMCDDIIFSDSSEIFITAKLDPENASPFNNGEFEGFGTALCWWANRVGYSPELTQQSADLFFGEGGLHFDIGRYNVGGGDDPSHNHITRSDSKVPGYATGFAPNGSIVYDWSADQNQRNVVLAAMKANPNLYVEGFSNSPPFFMTVSGCSTGNSDASKDNLKEANRADFAQYIADVSRHFKDEWGIEFKSYSPMNEPDTSYWGANSDKQEGCHFSSGSSESLMLVETRKALDAAGLTDVLVAGTDETSLDTTNSNMDKLTAEGKAALGRIDTHTYGGSQRAQVKAKAISMGKGLWMSEVDGGDTAGSNAGNMGAGLWLANRILADVNGMQPSAWVTWDIIDVHKDSSFTNPWGQKSEADNRIDQNGGIWGVGMADHDAKKILLTQKYYVFGQFSRYIRPGDTIIGTSSDRLLAAYNRKTNAVKIVAVNDGSKAVSYIFDLSALNVTAGAQATAYRTSGAYEGGEQWKNVGTAAVNNNAFSYTLPANSVTSFVVE